MTGEGQHEHISFDFLGYTFGRGKRGTGPGGTFISFTPAVSREELDEKGRRLGAGGSTDGDRVRHSGRAGGQAQPHRAGLAELLRGSTGRRWTPSCKASTPT